MRLRFKLSFLNNGSKCHVGRCVLFSQPYLEPAPSQHLGQSRHSRNVCWKIKARLYGLLCDSWSSRYSFRPRKDSPTPHVCILQMPLRLLLSNWLWKRINSHDKEGRKRELAYLAPGSVNPPVQMKSLIGPIPGEPGGGEFTVSIHHIQRLIWFCWGWFDPLIFLWVSEVGSVVPETLCDPTWIATCHLMWDFHIFNLLLLILLLLRIFN